MEFRRIRYLGEEVEFSASGSVTTADGRKIPFSMSFALSRVELESTSLRVVTGEDPLVLGFASTGARVIGQGIAFDINGDGQDERLPEVSGRGYLVFDRNGNRQVDDYTELFGPSTGNGFAELASLDRDRNGWIDENDPDFSRLGIWQPGKTLHRLGMADIGALYVGNVSTPWQGVGEMAVAIRSSSVYLNEDGTPGDISHIDIQA